MTTLAAELGARDYAVVALAGAFALSGIGLTFVMLKLFRLVGSLKDAVDGMTKETVPLIHDVDQTVKGVNKEIERVDGIMASAQSVARNVETISHTVQVTVTNPLVKALAFLAGARRAGKKLREK